jgi:hypothetical protein
MAEEKKTNPDRPGGSTSPPAKATARPALAPAAESSDPAVHQLLAERDIAARNNDTDAAEAATARLAELGYR